MHLGMLLRQLDPKILIIFFLYYQINNIILRDWGNSAITAAASFRSIHVTDAIRKHHRPSRCSRVPSIILFPLSSTPSNTFALSQCSFIKNAD